VVHGRSGNTEAREGEGNHRVNSITIEGKAPAANNREAISKGNTIISKGNTNRDGTITSRDDNTSKGITSKGITSRDTKDDDTAMVGEAVRRASPGNNRAS